MKTFTQATFLVLSIVCFVLFVLEFIPQKNKQPKNILTESFDSSLLRLNNKKKMVAYCDSIFTVQSNLNPGSNKDSLFADIAAVLIRKRFYHGWAEYGIGNNYMALFLRPLFYRKTVTSIVDIDDILGSSAAICVQQARVFAAVMETEKIQVRKVVFSDPQYGGHFAVEAFYQGNWHFFDVDKEPDLKLLRPENRPSLNFLQQNPIVLTKLYSHEDPEMIIGIFKTAKAQNFEKVEGKHLLLFQRITKILSYSMWLIFFALFLFIKDRKKKYAAGIILQQPAVSFSHHRAS